jgi:alpha-tubulin suppressor-like RCC1 family protein
VQVVGISTAVSVSSGLHHVCAALGNGSVQCWGSDSDGQLGRGGTVRADSSVPVTVAGLTHATRVAAGDDHSCALLATGGVSCWGRNNRGQLGNGAPISAGAFSLTPLAVVGLSGPVSALDAGGDHACAIVGGFVQCWGYNSAYQLGNNSNTASSTPVIAIGLTGASSISVGFNNSCAIANGVIWCWGNASQYQSFYPLVTTSLLTPQLTTVAATNVAAGYSHSCAVQPDTRVACVGANLYGQIGNLTTDVALIAQISTAANLIGATQVSVGTNSSCARLSNGQVWCWGRNDSGELGNGLSTAAISTPAPVLTVGCTLDIDGDGRVEATTDGLVLTRALLGFSGPSVVANALGVGAQRTSWRDIRAHLVRSCGVGGLAP